LRKCNTLPIPTFSAVAGMSVVPSKVSVGHICLEVSDVLAAKAFYNPLFSELGLKLVIDEKESVGWGNQNFAIFLAKPESRRVNRKRPTGAEYVVADHIALLLESRSRVDAAAAFMKKGGIQPLFAPEEHPEFVPDYYAVSFCDPDNNVIEFYSIS